MHCLNPAVRTKSVKTRNAKVYVLDSFAVLSYLENESSASFVRDLFRQARQRAIALWLSLLNCEEVLYIVERGRALQAAHRPIGIIDQLPISIADVDRHMVFS